MIYKIMKANENLDPFSISHDALKMLADLNDSKSTTHMTLMKSKVLVTMTMQEALSCQTILQKSGMVSSVGPWVTM